MIGVWLFLIFGILAWIAIFIFIFSSRMHKELDEIESGKREINPIVSIIFGVFLIIFSLQGSWWGFNEYRDIMAAINNQVDIVRFNNRVGFFIFGLAIPLFLLIIPVEKFRPDFVKKYNRQLNKLGIAALIVFFAFGFIGSSWIKARVENAGYVYCRNASGISALARTLVYTKNMATCEKQVALKTK